MRQTERSLITSNSDYDFLEQVENEKNQLIQENQRVRQKGYDDLVKEREVTKTLKGQLQTAKFDAKDAYMKRNEARKAYEELLDLTNKQIAKNKQSAQTTQQQSNASHTAIPRDVYVTMTPQECQARCQADPLCLVN